MDPLSALTTGVPPSPRKHLSGLVGGKERFWNRPLAILPCLRPDPETARGRNGRLCADGALRGRGPGGKLPGPGESLAGRPGGWQEARGGVPESVCDLVHGNIDIFFLSVSHYGGKVCHYIGRLCTLYKSCGVRTRTHPHMHHTHMPQRSLPGPMLLFWQSLPVRPILPAHGGC